MTVSRPSGGSRQGRVAAAHQHKRSEACADWGVVHDGLEQHSAALAQLLGRRVGAGEVGGGVAVGRLRQMRRFGLSREACGASGDALCGRRGKARGDKQRTCSKRPA